MIKYYKLQKDGKDFKFNTIRFWKNKIEDKSIFPIYPEEDFFEILFKKQIKLVDITNNKNQYIINIDNIGANGIATINFHNLNDVFDYFVVQIWDDKNITQDKDNQQVPERMWLMFYLQQNDFKLNNVQKMSCNCLYTLDQWMTFGSLFHDILKHENPQVKFLRKFKNRFIHNNENK